MRKAFRGLLLLLLLAVPAVPAAVFGQASNGDCKTGTASSSDPLNASYYPGGNPSGALGTASLGFTDANAKLVQGAANTVPSAKIWTPCAGKGEWADGQLHYKNTSGSGKSVTSLVLSDLTCITGPNCGSTQTIHSATNGVGIVYVEGYYLVTFTPESWNITGSVPDPLIPNVDPYHNQTTSAFPVSVSNGNTQSFWLDVLVPASAVSGYYCGTATITISGSSETLPICLAVWNFSIPAKSSLQNFWDKDGLALSGGYFGGSDNGYAAAATKYPSSNSPSGDTNTSLMKMDLDLAYLMLDHRLTSWDSVNPGLPSLSTCGAGCDWTTFEANYGPLLLGTSTHTLLSGAALTSISPASFNGGGVISTATFQSWATEFQAKYSLSQLFQTPCDEPGSTVGNWTTYCKPNTDRADGSTPIVPMLVTASLPDATAAGALGYINYMVANQEDNNNPYTPGNPKWSTYAPWLGGSGGGFSTQGGGPKLGIYGACPSHGACVNNYCADSACGSPNNGWPNGTSFPDPTVSVNAVRNRVMPWFIYLDGASILLYYDVARCWASNEDGNIAHQCQTSAGSTPTVNTSDPWTYQQFSGIDGDGNLTYPGTYAKIGTGAAGDWIPVPLPSIRLKLFRDGMQDYEYVYRLKLLGQTFFANTEAASFITNDYTIVNSNGPDEGCSGCLIAARNSMGNKLHLLSLTPAGSGIGRGILP